MARPACLFFVATILGAAAAQAADLAPLLATIREVGPEGKGNRAAAKAWDKLSRQATVEQWTDILAAIDGANPLAANWLHSLVDSLADRQLRDRGQLPMAKLEAFLGDQKHDGRARRLAFEVILRGDPAASDRLIPRMLDDSSLEMRRDAVSRVLSAAEKASAEMSVEAALANYRQALDSARDLDQVKLATEGLKKLGHTVDLPRHYGFLLDWQLLGPFDNHAGKGFAVAYPPESTVDLAATYPAQDGKVRWSPHHTSDEYGLVDLNKTIGKHMGVLAYAMAEFRSDKARPIELRLGTENANKIWLNGKLLSIAEVYHANVAMDQYVARGELKQGKNVILLKLCQDEQTVDWAQDWKFQLRVCDGSGKAVLAIDRPPSTGNQTAAAGKSGADAKE